RLEDCKNHCEARNLIARRVQEEQEKNAGQKGQSASEKAQQEGSFRDQPNDAAINREKITGRAGDGPAETAEDGPSPQGTTTRRPAPAAAEDGPDERLIAQLLAVLEKNPRRGTVLDRVYGLHVERGRLDELIGRYREPARGDRPDGVAAMIAGLLEAQRGRDAA